MELRRRQRRVGLPGRPRPGRRPAVPAPLAAGGRVLAVLVATVAVYAALILTATMQVTLATVLLLAGQSAYLMAAAVLLMTGRELLLLAALRRRWRPSGSGSPVARWRCPLGSDHCTGSAGASRWRWSSRWSPPAARPGRCSGSGRRRGRAGCSSSPSACWWRWWCCSPRSNELVNENYDALPLAVTLAALPLVLAWVSQRACCTATGPGCTTCSAARRRPPRSPERHGAPCAGHQLVFAATLVALSASGGRRWSPPCPGPWTLRYVLLALDYAVLGPALFAAMLLSLLGRADRVLETLGAGPSRWRRSSCTRPPRRPPTPRR